MNAITCMIRAEKMNLTSKKMIRGILASLFGALMVSCGGCGGGGGGGSSDSAAKSPSAPAPAKAINIDAEGDSTMAGVQNFVGTFAGASYSFTENGPTAVLQAELRSTFDNTVTVENRGVGGSSVCQRIIGDPARYKETLAVSLASDKAQIVIGNWAINDADSHMSESPSQYQQCLEQFVDIVRASGKTPVLEEPNPVLGAVYYPAEPGAYDSLPNYVAIMNAVAQEKGVLLIQQYNFIQSLPNWKSMLTDGVHPTDALYKIKADREASALTPLVKSMR